MRLRMKGQWIRMEGLVGYGIPMLDLLGIAQEALTVGSECDFSAGTLHQLGSQLLFKFGYVLADCGLADAQFIRCGREIAAFHHCQENLYSVVFQHFCKYSK